MKKTFEQIFSMLQKESLTKSERLSIENHLQGVMKANPVFRNARPSPYAWIFSLRQHAIVATFAILIMFGGGGSLFAEQALPGDIFYGFKKGINEEIRGWFANSVLDRAEWQLSLAERRLSEIEVLSNQKRLSPDLQNSLSKEVEIHTEMALDESVENIINPASSKSNVASLEMKKEDASLSDTEAIGVSMMSLGAPVEGPASVRAIMTPDISSKDIESFLELIKERKKALKIMREGANDKRTVIGIWGRMLLAEKLLFEARTAFDSGDMFSANEIFSRAKATLPGTSEADPVYSEDEPLDLEQESVEVIGEGAVEEQINPEFPSI